MLRNRKILVMALLACLVWSALALASDTPRYRHGGKNRADGIINTLAGSENALGQTAGERTFGTPLAVGASPSASPGLQVGITTYDYQHNGSTGRQVDQRNGKVQVSWMRNDQFSTALGRSVYWNKADVTGNVQPKVLDNGGSVNYIPLGNVGSSGGQAAITGGNRPGYTTFRNLPTGRGVLFAHDAPEPPATGAFWFAAVDAATAVGVFIQNNAPQPAGQAAGDEVIWPHGCTDVVGPDTVLHVVGNQSGTVLTDYPIFYWRGTVSGTAVTWSTPILMDTVSVLSVIVEADPTSNDVAVVYSKPRTSGTQVDNDVAYRLSTNGGVSFGGVINVTNYTDSSLDRSYTDIDAVYDDDGTLHIIWPTLDFRPGDGTFFLPVDMAHWNDVRNTVRVISTATWTNTCDQTTFGGFRGGTFNLQYAKPNIVVKPAGVNGIAEELLYAVWVQFGGHGTLERRPEHRARDLHGDVDQHLRRCLRRFPRRYVQPAVRQTEHRGQARGSERNRGRTALRGLGAVRPDRYRLRHPGFGRHAGRTGEQRNLVFHVVQRRPHLGSPGKPHRHRNPRLPAGRLLQ